VRRSTNTNGDVGLSWFSKMGQRLAASKHLHPPVLVAVKNSNISVAAQGNFRARVSFFRRCILCWSVCEFPQCRRAQNNLCFTRSDWPVHSRDKGRWPYVSGIPYLFDRKCMSKGRIFAVVQKQKTLVCHERTKRFCRETLVRLHYRNRIYLPILPNKTSVNL